MNPPQVTKRPVVRCNATESNPALARRIKLRSGYTVSVNSDSDYAHGRNVGEQAIVAAFADRESAHVAAKRLREESFHKIWIGVTLAGTAIESEDESLGAKIGRFFSGESDGSSLTETLMRHGVTETEAQRVERQLEPDCAILTVNGDNHPELAAQIVENCDGVVLSGQSFVYANVEWTAPDNRPGSELLGYEDPTEFARGERVDDAGLTRLRDERLLTDIPTLREDIFIARFDDEELGTRKRSDRTP
jgi:hypothetical protein